MAQEPVSKSLELVSGAEHKRIGKILRAPVPTAGIGNAEVPVMKRLVVFGSAALLATAMSFLPVNVPAATVAKQEGGGGNYVPCTCACMPWFNNTKICLCVCFDSRNEADVGNQVAARGGLDRGDSRDVRGPGDQRVPAVRPRSYRGGDQVRVKILILVAILGVMAGALAARIERVPGRMRDGHLEILRSCPRCDSLHAHERTIARCG